MSRCAPLPAMQMEQDMPSPGLHSVRSCSNGHLISCVSVNDEDFSSHQPLKKTKTEVQKHTQETEGSELRHFPSHFLHRDEILTAETRDKELPDVLHELESNKPITFKFQAKVMCVAPCRQGAIVGLKDGTVSMIKFSPAQERTLFQGLMHTSEVTCLAITHDGKCALSGSWDKSIRVWSLISLDYVNTFTGHTQSVTCLATTPEGKFAVSGSADNTVRLWHMEEGLEWMTFKGHTHIVKTLAISPGGRLCASGSVDGIVKVWGLEERRELANLEGHTDFVTCLSFSPDGSQLVSGSQDMTAKVWDVELRREIATLVGHSRYIECLALTPDGLHLATGAGDNTVKLWSMEDFHEETTFVGHSQEVISLCVTMDSRYVISGAQDNTVKVWSVQELIEVATFEGHSDRVKCVGITPNGSFLVSAAGKEVKVWMIEERSGAQVFEGNTQDVTSIAVSPDGRFIVSGSYNGEIKLWDAEECQEIASFSGHTSWVTCIHITPDGRYAVSASVDRSVSLWDIHRREKVAEFEGHSSFIECLCISADGRFLITGSGDNFVKVWNLSLKQEIASLQGHKKWVTCVKVTSDGLYILSASMDRTVRVWSLITKAEVATMAGHTDSIECLAITPNGDMAVTGSGDFTLKMWSLATWSEVATLAGHRGRVKCLSVSPDGKLVVSGSADMSIKVWSLVEQRELTTLLGHTLIVKLISITPDSKYVVSASEDNTVKIWSLDEGREMGTLRQHTRQIHCFALNPDGSRIILGSADNTLTSIDMSAYLFPASYCNPIACSASASSVLTPSNIQKLISGILTPEKVYQSKVMPQVFNSLHISTYFNHDQACGFYLRAGATMLRGAYGSPVTVALRRNTSKCIDTILEYLSTISQNDSASLVFSAITDDLPQLLLRNSPFLVPFFSQLLTVPSQTNLPQFIAPLQRLPTTHFFPTRLIHLSDFVKLQENETEMRLVEFFVSVFRWNFTPGSVQSLLLLRALRTCRNKKVLTTEFASTLISTKWKYFFPLTLTLTLIYSLLLVNLVALMFPYWRNDVLGACFIFFNSFTLLYELIQMIGFGRLYLLDIWNVIDLSRGALSILWTLLLLDGTDPQYLRLVVVLLCFLRGFTYFRTFTMTRIFVYMTIQVVMEIYSFLAILAYSVFAFGILASVLSEDNGVLTSWATAFNLLIGNFDNSEFGFVQWLIFIAAAVVNVVIMLNLLISILGGAYEKTQMSLHENNILQMLGLITEYESIMFWRRSTGSSTVMVKCRAAVDSTGEEQSEESEWVGGITRITKAIKDEHKMLSKKLNAIERQFIEAETTIRTDIQGLTLTPQNTSPEPQVTFKAFVVSPPVEKSSESSETEEDEIESEVISLRVSSIGDASRRGSANPLVVADFVRRISINPMLSPDFARRASVTKLSRMSSMRMSQMSIQEEEDSSVRKKERRKMKDKMKDLEEKMEYLREGVSEKMTAVEEKVQDMEAKLNLILEALMATE